MPFINEVLVANGTTSLGRIVFAKAALDMIVNDHVIGMVVNVGGAGYIVGETFDVGGGTAIGAFVARGVVTSVSAGVVTGVKYVSAGAYSTLPGVTGAATANSSAAGNNALTVDLTTETARWTLNRSTYVNDATDFEWIVTSVKATNPATVGMDTITGAGNDSCKLMVASGFNGGSTFEGQPDASPTPLYLNLPAQNPEIFLSTTERRNNICARDGNNVQYGGVGLFIPLTNAEANYPFPGFVHGQSTGIKAFTQQYVSDGVGNSNAGVCNPTTRSNVFGAYRYRDNLSTQWLTIASNPVTGGAIATMWPFNQSDTVYSFTHAPSVSGKNANPFGSTARQVTLGDDAGGWFVDPNGAVQQGVPGVSPLGTGVQMSLVVESHIIKSQSADVQAIGIVDGYSNCNGIGLTAFEEIESFNSASRYIVFPDTNGADQGQWVAMEIL